MINVQTSRWISTDEKQNGLKDYFTIYFLKVLFNFANL